MASDAGDPDESQRDAVEDPGLRNGDISRDDNINAESQDGDEANDEEEEEEPRLKYARMTSHLASVYKNGDMTSVFLVAGDKMFIGTHNGNIHVVSLPSFEFLRVYHAHSASITALSISPFPQTAANERPDVGPRTATAKSLGTTSQLPPTARAPRQPVVPNVPSNAVYIASSSIDGNVCIASLVDVKDVQLRNFARPVQAVALSPEFKNDRSYISGGLAGNLVLTVGGRTGASTTSTTTGTASATASGWLNSMGLGGNSGKDTVLHSGEGPISTVKWSLSGKYIAWLNEQGIKVMRSNLHLEGVDTEFAWKRIGHVDRPQEDGWEEMASVWKGRIEWVDEKVLETDEETKLQEVAMPTPATMKLRQQSAKDKKLIEKLLVGWGGTIWVINMHPGDVGTGKNVRERTAGRAEIIKILRMDCIISGLSLYTPTLLLVLAYINPDKNDPESPSKHVPKSSGQNEANLTKGGGHQSKNSTESAGSEPSGGIRRRQNASIPELQLINLNTSEEVDSDRLTMSRFERLTAADYHLGVLQVRQDMQLGPISKGALATLADFGSGMWNSTVSATLGSAASVQSKETSSKSDGDSDTKLRDRYKKVLKLAHPHMIAPGMKIFIHSPYDCIIATKRDLSDHLSWLLEQKQYQRAWELVSNHPEAISFTPDKIAETAPGTPERKHTSTDDFYDDTTSTVDSASRLINSVVEKEKRRIGEPWIQQLVSAGDWVKAGEVCGRVLGTSSRWEHWVWTFAAAKKFDEITNYIPTTQLRPPLPSSIYEVVLGHYIAQNKPRLREMLDLWPPELFDIRNVTTELENLLKYRDVREDSVEDGEIGRDWRLVMESLGKLYVADGRSREALKCYIQLRDAEAAMSLVKDFHLVDAIADDIPGFILLRVSKEQVRSAPLSELEAATSEAISLLVEEAHHGLVRPQAVIKQLQEKDLTLYQFFYLRSLWRGDGLKDEETEENRGRLIADSRALLDDFADLVFRLFATYDRPLLMDFLRSSTFYTFELASQVCEQHDYIPELVYLYSKTGQTKRALFLIIDRLADVSQAIAFAKQQDDPDLWEDLLNYSMDKPRFIRGLLEEVGTAINPITLVRRIPEGLEIEGLREGLSRMVKEYEIQFSISSGVARVLRGEVATAQISLRSGQRRGIRFDVYKPREPVEVSASEDAKFSPEDSPPAPPQQSNAPPQPGHCVACLKPFVEDEKDTLVGFACGDVFHLAHLLTYGNNGPRPATPLDVDVTENGEFSVHPHSIGSKVTHARLLRDKIRHGCPACSR